MEQKNKTDKGLVQEPTSKERTSDDLSNKLGSLFTDKPVNLQTSNLVEEIRKAFDEHPDQVMTVRKIADMSGYSNVRVNNIMNDQLELGYVTRVMSNGRYYYKRNVIEQTEKQDE